jgi:hypothetical protein
MGTSSRTKLLLDVVCKQLKNLLSTFDKISCIF